MGFAKGMDTMPKKLELPLEIPFTQEANITHRYKEGKTKISLGDTLGESQSKNRPKLMVTGITSMILHLPKIYVPNKKGKLLFVEGRLIIEKLHWQEK